MQVAEFKPRLQAWREKNGAKLERAWERTTALETEMRLAVGATAADDDDDSDDDGDDDGASSGGNHHDDGKDELRSVINSLDLSPPSGQRRSR